MPPDFRWQRGAACRGVGPTAFFPAGTPKRARAHEEQAKRLCGQCPVQPRCLAFAMEHNEAFGVWGGLNENERLALTLAWRGLKAGATGTADGTTLQNRQGA